MGHPHAHGHGGPRAARAEGRRSQRRRLAAALALAAAYMAAELVGGLWTGSLALLADAGHMLSDVAALALSLFALWLGERPAPIERTFGWRRFEILAALANGAALVVVAVLIVAEAVERMSAPRPVLGLPMLAIAAGGLAVNLAALVVLQGGRDESLNLRGAWLHVLGDTLGSVGAMAAGVLIYAKGWVLADPIASVAIAALVLRASWALLRETVDVLLEAAPAGLDVRALQGALLDVDGVVSIHDLHVWTITSGMVSLSCHAHVEAHADDHAVLAALQKLLRDRFAIHHVTIQIEPEGFEEHVEVC